MVLFIFLDILLKYSDDTNLVYFHLFLKILRLYKNSWMLMVTEYSLRGNTQLLQFYI